MDQPVDVTKLMDRPWEDLPAGDYAIVELFGHTTMVGRVEEVERFGTKMLGLEPLFKQTLLRQVLHGGAAIYRLTPCTREVAWLRQPCQDYQLPAAIRAVLPPELLPAPESNQREDYDDASEDGTEDRD